MAKSTQSQTVTQPLRGKELLAQFKKLESMNKSAKARACGYVKRSKNGKERVQLSEFMNALLEANGVVLDVEPHSTGRRGRGLTHRVKVQKNGAIIICAGYTKKIGLEPGQPFEIQLGRKSIKLTAIEPETEEGFDDSGDEDEEFDDDEIE